MNQLYELSTPNIFRHFNKMNITIRLEAKDKKEATDRFYEYLDERFQYAPDIISIKELKNEKIALLDIAELWYAKNFDNTPKNLFDKIVLFVDYNIDRTPKNTADFIKHLSSQYNNEISEETYNHIIYMLETTPDSTMINSFYAIRDLSWYYIFR